MQLPWQQMDCCCVCGLATCPSPRGGGPYSTMPHGWEVPTLCTPLCMCVCVCVCLSVCQCSLGWVVGLFAVPFPSPPVGGVTTACQVKRPTITGLAPVQAR